MLSDLQFTISCNKRALISIMKSIDMGITDPELFKSLSMIQKELRDTIKGSYDLQKKMKDFYKGIRDELAEIITINVNEIEDENYVEEVEDESTLYLIDMDRLTLDLDEARKK